MSPSADPHAHYLVGRAIKSGELHKPTRCENCEREIENPRNLHAHHADYSKPLDVRWLCPRCHRAEPQGINGRTDLRAPIHIRLPEDLHAALVAEAERLGVSLNAVIAIALRRSQEDPS